MDALSVNDDRTVKQRSKRDWSFGQFVPDGGIGGGGGSSYGNGGSSYGAASPPAIPSGYGSLPVVNAEPASFCCTCQQGPAVSN
jgi:hypothetical protein